MAKTTGFGQLELLGIEERDSILFGLYARGGVFKKAIDEDVADDLIVCFDEVDDDMAYANSGRGPWGYRDYGEAVSELLNDQFRPLLRKITDAAKKKRSDLALITAEGIVLGLYRFERECRYDYIDAIPDDCSYMAEEAVDTWKKLYPDDTNARMELKAFIEANCPGWVKEFKW
jgi:hypothetical protein